VDYLSGMLDDDSSVKGARNIVLWLQPGIYNPSAWVKLFQRIIVPNDGFAIGSKCCNFPEAR